MTCYDGIRYDMIREYQEFEGAYTEEENTYERGKRRYVAGSRGLKIQIAKYKEYEKKKELRSSQN